MKACVLAYSRKKMRGSRPLYERLLKAMKEKFGSADFIPIEKVVLRVDGELKAEYKGKDLSSYDLLLPRIGPSYAPFGYLVLKAIEGKVCFPNKPEAYLIANNKFSCLMRLAREGIPVPRTFLTISKKVAKKLCEELAAPSFIFKLLGKAGGRGVIYAKDLSSAYTIVDALPHKRGEMIFIEEYLPNPGEDIRLFVIGDEVAAAMKRIAKRDEIRSNIHAGGKGVPYEAPEKMKKIAIDASRAIGAEICGVDVLVSEGKPYVLECNMNPGFKITEVTGVDLFSAIADFLEEKMKKRRAPSVQSLIQRISERIAELFT